MIVKLPEANLHLETSIDEYEKYLNLQDRRLYLTSEIKTSEEESEGAYMSTIDQLVDDIMEFNRQDNKSKVKTRKPIRLYINSPGGIVHEGFSLISAIELSETPVYTINIGMRASMAFLIGISGHKRFSLPNMMFLMHDGTNFAWDSGNKVQDKLEFDRRFSENVIKKHVLKHSNMKATEYDALSRVEYYMLPEDAKERNFIDEIVTDITTIL